MGEITTCNTHESLNIHIFLNITIGNRVTYSSTYTSQHNGTVVLICTGLNSGLTVTARVTVCNYPLHASTTTLSGWIVNSSFQLKLYEFD